MYLDRTDALQTGSLEVHAGNLSITDGGTSGPASFGYVIAN